MVRKCVQCSPNPPRRTGSEEDVVVDSNRTFVCTAAGAEWKRSEVVNSTQGFYSLSGLQPGTEYHLKIIHENDTRWEKLIQTVGPGISDCF